jgi:HEAT repeat protein
LGKIKDSAALEPLLELLNDGFWHQHAAVYALGEMGDAKAVPHLLKLLHDELLMEPAMEALGKIGDLRAVAPLEGIMVEISERQALVAEQAIDEIRKKMNQGT